VSLTRGKIHARRQAADRPFFFGVNRLCTWIFNPAPAVQTHARDKAAYKGTSPTGGDMTKKKVPIQAPFHG
jgi:hypothetical protein